MDSRAFSAPQNCAFDYKS